MARVPVDIDRTALHVAARQVLLDALEALAAHREAVILAGAQAVYLHSQDADFAVAAFTSDGDLALDPRRLGPDPRLDEAMEAAGFSLAMTTAGRAEPGKWVRAVEVLGVSYDIPVDLIVPAQFAGAGRRSARIPPHSSTAAMRAPGLEVVLADRATTAVAALDPDDDRVVEVYVAGVAALFVAKAHKIADRLQDAKAGKAHRLVDKDAGDVVRLMTTSNASLINFDLHGLLADESIANVVRTGIELLNHQFGRRSGPGVEMAVRSLAGGTREDSVVRSLCVAYTQALLRDLDRH